MENINIDKIVDYTKQFIETVTPVAKQAYDIGLLTLRIDAAQTLFYGLLALLVVVYVARNFGAWVKQSNDYQTVEGGTLKTLVGGVGGVIAGMVAVANVGNIWIWTKLIAPDLWLAHQAVEKLLK